MADIVSRWQRCFSLNWHYKISTLCSDVLAEEQAHEAIFQPLPFHYIEVAHLLLRHAKDAFQEGDDVLYQASLCKSTNNDCLPQCVCYVLCKCRFTHTI